MRSAPQTVGDQALRLRIALCGFELDQTIEQFIDELRFLRGHSVSPCLRTRWSCRWRIMAPGGAAQGHRNLKALRRTAACQTAIIAASALDIASILEALAEWAEKILTVVRRSLVKEHDNRHCRLLRARRERPRGRAADERDELVPFLIELHAIPHDERGLQ